jgi:hypothetical protein
MQWDSLPLPNNRFARCWTFLEGKMYVGAYNFPEVWEYNPVTNDWLQIDLPEVGNGVEHDFSVASLASFQGQLVVGIIDLSGAYNHEFWMGDIELGNWTDIPRVTTTFNTQAPLTKMVELNGWLYGIDGSVGVFRWQPGMDSLEQLKSPRNKPDEEIEDVSAIAVHNQQIIVGHSRYYDGVFRLTTDLEWEHMTPPKSNSALSDAPRDVLTILSYQGNLYMAGAVGAYVRIWDPADTDCLDFGDWKLISNIRCYDEGKCQNQFRTEHTPGLIGIGDTLYAASWEYVLKLPISDV